MKLEKWALIAEVVGAGAIVITLILVLFEIRGNTDAIRAQTISSQVEAERERRNRIIENRGGIAELVVKGQNEEPLTGLEDFRLLIYYNDTLDNFEWQYSEVTAGRLPENQIDRRIWRAMWRSEPGLAEVYENTKARRDPAFVEFVETIIRAVNGR